MSMGVGVVDVGVKYIVDPISRIGYSVYEGGGLGIRLMKRKRGRTGKGEPSKEGEERVQKGT